MPLWVCIALPLSAIAIVFAVATLVDWFSEDAT